MGFPRTALSVLSLMTLSLLLSALPARAHYAEEEHHEGLRHLRENMVDIATRLLESVESRGGIEEAVGYDRRALLMMDMDHPERRNYVYWPYLRAGLPLEFMTADQKQLVHDLLEAALSARGYLSAVQIMRMEEILADAETIGFPRGPENYTLALFGEPDLSGEWGWRFEGHHLSLNFTLAPAGISVTPSFFGASPAEIRTGDYAGFRNLSHLHDAGLDLVNALDDEQQEQAIVDDEPPFDILSGTLNRPEEEWDDWKRLGESGIAVDTLNPDQKALVQRVIDDVITAYRPGISEAYLSAINLDELRFTWYGGTDSGDPHYYRLDGPDFFFEYDLVQNDGNHVHTVWRSKSGDFGEDLLMRHRHDEPH